MHLEPTPGPRAGPCLPNPTPERLGGWAGLCRAAPHFELEPSRPSYGSRARRSYRGCIRANCGATEPYRTCSQNAGRAPLVTRPRCLCVFSFSFLCFSLLFSAFLFFSYSFLIAFPSFLRARNQRKEEEKKRKRKRKEKEKRGKEEKTKRKENHRPSS